MQFWDNFKDAFRIGMIPMLVLTGVILLITVAYEFGGVGGVLGIWLICMFDILRTFWGAWK